MVEQIDNPANKAMHYGSPNVGILNPPDKLPTVTLYSPTEAEKQYNKMQYDIYDKQQHTKAPDKHKFPKILKILGGIIGIGTVLIFGKNLLKYAKGLFKRGAKI